MSPDKDSPEPGADVPMVMPTRRLFDMRDLGDGRFELLHQEEFNPPGLDPEVRACILENTRAAFPIVKAMIEDADPEAECVLESLPDISYRLRASKKTIASIIVTEMLPESNIGGMTIADMMAMAVGGAVYGRQVRGRILDPQDTVKELAGRAQGGG